MLLLSLSYKCVTEAAPRHGGGGYSAVRTTTTRPQRPRSKWDLLNDFVLFHGAFALAAMYLAMLLTSWSPVSMTGTKAGHARLWVKTVAQWCTQLIYLWRLATPPVLTNREFA